MLDETTAFDIDDYLEEIIKNQAERCKYSAGKRSIMYNTLKRILPRVVADTEDQQQHPTSLCWQALQVVDQLDDAIYGSDWDGGKNRRGPKDSQFLWLPLTRPRKQGENWYDVRKEQVEQALHEYLARQWHSDYLDWVFVDLLVFWECDAYLNSHLPGVVMTRRMVPGFYAFVFGAVAGVAALAGWWISAAISAALAAYYMLDYATIKLRVYRNSRKILLAMSDGRRSLNFWDSGVLSPTRVREALVGAEKNGVVWPNAMWPVLDRVVARNPSVWRVW
jgi:hypothetical protein